MRKFNKRTETANINWSHYFAASYVRQIFSIVDHKNGQGHIEKSNYLPDVIYKNDFLYREGDLFIIKEFRNRDFKKTSYLVPSLYYLIQVEPDEHSGFRILSVVREDSTEFPEWKLVSKFINNNRLLSLISHSFIKVD